MDLDAILSRNFTSISDEYREFAVKKAACRKCSIYKHYKQVGQSEGNAVDPTFMLVGEALGKDETEQVRPFVGWAGQRLRRELRKHATTFTRKNTLISNVVACRPLNNVFPRDSAGPYEIYKQDEGTKSVLARDVVHWCAENWLRKEVALVRPKVLITLGGQALDFVRGERGITANRGTWKFLPALQVWSMATYHPSYVMRCEHDKAKEHIPHQFAEDIEKVAKTWRSVVNDDPRMEMSSAEWRREYALDKAITRGVVFPEALHD
jgi:DNA polymerase